VTQPFLDALAHHPVTPEVQRTIGAVLGWRVRDRIKVRRALPKHWYRREPMPPTGCPKYTMVTADNTIIHQYGASLEPAALVEITVMAALPHSAIDGSASIIANPARQIPVQPRGGHACCNPPAERFRHRPEINQIFHQRAAIAGPLDGLSGGGVAVSVGNRSGLGWGPDRGDDRKQEWAVKR
jgi:hypothetical protein